jgi:hypothetical protein
MEIGKIIKMNVYYHIFCCFKQHRIYYVVLEFRSSKSVSTGLKSGCSQSFWRNWSLLSPVLFSLPRGPLLSVAHGSFPGL